MHKLVSFILFRLKMLLKSPFMLIMLFVMPIIFSLIFGSISIDGGSDNSKKVKLGLVANDCEICEEVAVYIERNSMYEWERLTLSEAQEAVTDQKIAAAVVVPNDIVNRLEQANPILDVIVNQKTEQYIVLSHYIDGVSNQLFMFYETVKTADEQIFSQVLEQVNNHEPVEIKHESYQHKADSDEQSSNTSSASGIGFAIMFMMFALSGSAAAIHQERKDFTWQRLHTTSISKGTLLSGYITTFWIMGWLQLATLFIFMGIVYGVKWGSITYLILFSSIVILTVVSFSMMMVSIVRSKQQAETVNAIVIVSTCMLGGVYWPIEIVPKVMQYIGYFTPQYWMMKGFNYGLMEKISIAEVWQPWLILLGVTSVFLWIAVRNMNKEIKA